MVQRQLENHPILLSDCRNRHPQFRLRLLVSRLSGLARAPPIHWCLGGLQNGIDDTSFDEEIIGRFYNQLPIALT